MEKLKGIIRKNRMSTRPEFYSGRGATTCDLNGDILEGIWKDIAQEFGDAAAKSFVKMVDGINVISATAFLQELYDLFDSGWKYRKRKNAPGILIQKNKDGEYSLAHGMMSIGTALSSGSDQTASIKNWFLQKHGIKVKSKTIYGEYL